MTTNFQSIKVVADKLMRHPMLVDVPLEAIIDYTVEFMEIVGCPTMFLSKTDKVHIENYRGVLPCDFAEMQHVKYKDFSMRYVTDAYGAPHSHSFDYTFEIKGRFIFTSLKEGDIDIAYTAIGVDEEGFPLIPENSNFTRALESYIKVKHFTILFDMGKIKPEIYANAQQQYAWNVASCETEFNRLTIPEAESFYNSVRNLLLMSHEYNSAFTHSGTKEILRYN